jgi:hypothetical protein
VNEEGDFDVKCECRHNYTCYNFNPDFSKEEGEILKKVGFNSFLSQANSFFNGDISIEDIDKDKILQKVEKTFNSYTIVQRELLNELEEREETEGIKRTFSHNMSIVHQNIFEVFSNRDHLEKIIGQAFFPTLKSSKNTFRDSVTEKLEEEEFIQSKTLAFVQRSSSLKSPQSNFLKKIKIRDIHYEENSLFNILSNKYIMIRYKLYKY